MKTRLLMATAVALALSACAPIRPSKFQCPHPEGVSCMSTQEVYEYTEHADSVTGRGAGKPVAHATTTPATRTEPANAWVQPSRVHTVAEEDGALALFDDPSAPAPAAASNAAPAPAAEPLRAPAKVLRIWLAPWEDTRGDLHLAGFVYSEVEGRRWRVGQPSTPPRPSLHLIDAPRAANTSTQAAK